MTFSVSIRNMETHIESVSVLAPKTVQQKRAILKQFADFCKSSYGESESEIVSQLMKQKPEDRTINATDVIQLFINHLSKRILPNTVKSYVSHVIGYFNYRGIKLTILDLKVLRYPKQIREQKHPLSHDEVKQILDQSDYKRKTLYLVLLSSGMRIGETLQLRKKDFDTTGKRIMINIPAQVTKTKTERRTFVSSEASEYLMKKLNEINDTDLVFRKNDSRLESVNENQILARTTNKCFPNMEKYQSKTGKITLHSFRAFFITQAVRKVSDSFAHTLAGQMGYLSMYKRYDNDSLLEDYLKLEPNLIINNDFGIIKDSDNKQIRELEDRIEKMEKIHAKEYRLFKEFMTKTQESS